MLIAKIVERNDNSNGDRRDRIRDHKRGAARAAVIQIAGDIIHSIQHGVTGTTGVKAGSVTMNVTHNGFSCIVSLSAGGLASRDAKARGPIHPLPSSAFDARVRDVELLDRFLDRLLHVDRV